MVRDTIEANETTGYFGNYVSFIYAMGGTEYNGNNRDGALYEKMGFRIVGVRPNGIRLKDGTLLNEYCMIREIKR